CGIILAAGEGNRLRSFVKKLRGYALPKQYVNFIGQRSMLEHTFYRAQKMIPAERLFTVVSQRHLRHPDVAREAFKPADGLRRRTTRQQGHRSRSIAAACASVQTLS